MKKMAKRILAGLVIALLIVCFAGYAVYWKSLHNAEVVASPTNENEIKLVELDHDQGNINILILGSDTGDPRDPADDNEDPRTDAIMLATANIYTRHVSIISIPRDTRVKIEGVGFTKINHSDYLGYIRGGTREGTLEIAKAVSNLLGVSINYFVKIDYQGFEQAIDAVDGIEIDLPYAIDDESSHCHLPAGKQHLTGQQALTLVRSRLTLPHGDFDRQKHQYMVMAALADKVLDSSKIEVLPELAKVVYGYLTDTNISVPEAVSLGYAFKDISRDDITYFQLPGHGITAYDPLIKADLYFFEPDEESVKDAVQKALSLNQK